MRTSMWFQTAMTLVAAGTLLVIPSSAQQYKMTWPIVPGLAVPDGIESSIGTLTLSDGYTNAATATIYDNLDQSRTLQAYLLAIPIVNQTGDRVSAETQKSAPPPNNDQIHVNWLYGSYVPKDVPLESMNGDMRFKLYIRQTYTTYGIYIKTAFFATRDQVHGTYPEWGDGFEGYMKRFGSRQGQFIIQNSVTSLGDGLLGWEPRYDRCRCSGFWPRTRHAIVRNFVTYDRSEKSLRPQLLPYLGAFSGSVIAATAWEPGNPEWQVKGYQAVITQVPVGMGINWIGEFAPEIVKALHKKKKTTAMPEGR